MAPSSRGGGEKRHSHSNGNSYDLSSFVNKGEGNLDNDVNIAKLALALEVGAAVGYVSDTMKLKSPDMIELEKALVDRSGRCQALVRHREMSVGSRHLGASGVHLHGAFK